MAVKVLIDKESNRLWLYQNGQIIREYPVATGRDPAQTPEGSFSVVFKTHNPSWTNPATGETVPGGVPENPLGARWIGLGVGDTAGRVYGIHGTNRPESIGHHVSLGCVRMHNEDVQELYELVPLGSIVTIRSGAG
jgi:lipoprotein-anchoring transpeptidase ErfK/SrfK